MAGELPEKLIHVGLVLSKHPLSQFDRCRYDAMVLYLDPFTMGTDVVFRLMASKASMKY